jgi:hypothetical protein
VKAALRAVTKLPSRRGRQIVGDAVGEIAFDSGVGRDTETAHEREIERLPAKIGQLAVAREFFSQEVRKMSARGPHC